jgi:hypothetical protein
MKRKTPDERIKALEARRSKGRQEPPVVVGLPGELPSDTGARVHAGGRKSPALIVPHVPEVETWERQASAYQSWLLSRCADIADAEFMAPSAEEIDAAYGKSMTA